MNPIPAIKVIKFGIGALSSIGVGIIVDNAVKMVTPVEIGLFRKGLIWIGSTALAGFAGEYVGKHAEETFQTTVNFGRAVIQETKKKLDEYNSKKNEETAMET